MDILVVDSDRNDRERVCLSLQQSGVDVDIEQAETPEKAIRSMLKSQFDVVLLDYNLPQRNGIELLYEMNAIDMRGTTTFIITSTDENDEHALASINAGAQDFLTKQEITLFRLKRAIIKTKKQSGLEQKLLASYMKTKTLAEQDFLTGLSNRNSFDQSLKVTIANNLRIKNNVALLLIDLDHFKHVNDSYGHDVGDQLLIEVVKRINGQLPELKFFSRLGGDEFALILTNLASQQAASDVAERIIHAFKEPCFINGQMIQTTLSIGIAMSPADSIKAKDLFKFADIAMYRAKQEGRNRFSFFELKMQQQTLDDYTMEANLRLAHSKHLLLLHYQPLICGKTRQLVGAEALIRWPHQGAFISPDKFIPVAERSLLIVDIGWKIIEDALDQLSIWASLSANTFSMSINLSTVQLLDDNFAEKLTLLINSKKVAPSFVTLEITETALLAKAEEAESILLELSNIGFKIALDDFGTGFSSLSHLINFPLDIVKIDKSLMPTASKGLKEQHIVAGLVSMAKSLTLQLVAEGIEEQVDLDLCAQLEVDRFQGYYFDKPLPAKDFTDKYFS